MSEPDSEYTDMSVPDEGLPEDLRPGDENPLAEPADDDADRQDMGDPHIEGLERDGDDNVSMPETGDSGDSDDSGDSGEDDGES